ncbi:unnamed protein product [Caenorhabditis sp. 36 PRJEB53466]|nr:unnamed protein product [Caenorhabditis sp. 36 PRJEB53466]
MTSFPLPQLADLALQNIFDQMEPCEIVWLSLTSSKIGNYMRQAYPHCASLHLNYYANSCNIWIEACPGQERRLHLWTIVNGKNEELPEVKLNVNGTPFTVNMSFAPSGKQYGVYDMYCDNYKPFIIQFLRHLTKLFNVPLFVRFHSEVVANVDDFVALPEVQTCKKFDIILDRFADADLSGLWAMFSKNELTVSEEYRDDRRIHKTESSLHIHPAPWLTRDHFLGLNSEEIVISGSSLKSNDIRDFIAQWQRGDCADVRFLCLKRNNSELVFADIVENIDCMEWNGNRVGIEWIVSRFQIYQIDDAFDIVRQDGTMASIKLTDDNTFLFVVAEPDFDDDVPPTPPNEEEDE